MALPKFTNCDPTLMAEPKSTHIDQPKRKALLIRTLASVACTAGIAGLAALPMFSQEIPITDQLAQVESKLNGRVDEKGSVEQRISNLETKLFGKKSKGDMSTRLQKIWKALGASPQSSSMAGSSTKGTHPNGSANASDGARTDAGNPSAFHADRSPSTIDTNSHADSSPSTIDATSHADTSPSIMDTTSHADRSPSTIDKTSRADSSPSTIDTTSHADSAPATMDATSHADSSPATMMDSTSHADGSPAPMDTTSHADTSPSTMHATAHPSTVSSEDPGSLPAVRSGMPTEIPAFHTESSEALPMVSGAGLSMPPPWTAALNGNGLSERDRAITIAPPIANTAPSDQQSKILHVGVSKTETVNAASENLQSQSDGDLLKRAKQLLSANRLVEARQILDYLVDRNIKCTEGYLLLGDISAHTGNSVDALRNYWLARNLDPENLVLQDRVKGAENFIKSKVRTYHADSHYFPTPFDVRSVVNEGVRLWGLGCPEQASLMFEHALRMDPNNVNAYFNLGAVAEWQGKYAEALNDYLHASASLNHQGPYPWLGTSGRPTTSTDVRHLLTGVARSFGVPYLPIPMQRATPVPQYNKGAPYLSGGEDTTDIHMDVGQAIEDVRRKMQLNVGQMNIPTLPINQNFHTDTCDRCRILRTKAMGPD